MPSMYKNYDIDLPNVDPNGIAEDQTTGGAANLTLDGALCDLGTSGQFDIADSYSSGISGVKIGIESAANLSAITFTVTGKDQDGNSTTEDITGPNATTVQSTKYWSQITQIAVDAAVGTNVEIGTVDEVITATYPLNWRSHEAATVAVTGLTGTCQFDIDESFTEVRTVTDSSDLVWITNQSNQTAVLTASLTLHAQAARLKVDSYSSGAEFQFTITSHP